MAVVELDLPYLWLAKGRPKLGYAFYRRGGLRIPLNSPDGHRLREGNIGIPEAHRAVHASFEAKGEDSKHRGAPIPGSLLDGIIEYRASPEWQQLSQSTKENYNSQYNWLLTVADKGKGVGRRPMATMDSEVVRKLRKERYEGPEEGRSERKPNPGVVNLLKVALGSLFAFVKGQPKRFRLPRGWQSPTTGVKLLKGGDGHRPWEEHEIDDFREKWNSICLERAAFEALLNTGQRGCDIWPMQVRQYRDGKIQLRQMKTNAYILMPAPKDFRAVIDPWLKSHGDTVFFPIAPGRSITPDCISKKLRAAIRKVGLPHECTLHGLRVTFATRLIELGADYDTISSIVGHRTMAMAIKYTEQRRRARLGVRLHDRGLAAQRGVVELAPPLEDESSERAVLDRSVCSALTSSPKEPAVRDIPVMPSAGIVTPGAECSVAAAGRVQTIDLCETKRDQITVNAQPSSPSPPVIDVSVADGALAPGSRQTSEALQSGASESGAVEPVDPTEFERKLPKPPSPSVLDAPSTGGHTDKRPRVVVAQMSRDHYDVRQGPSRIGYIVFCDGQAQWGWRFVPIVAGLRPSRTLHRTPESSLTGRFRIASVITRSFL